MTPELVTAPTTPIVSLEDFREHLRLDSHDEDFLASALLKAATAMVDGWNGILGRAVMAQTWRETFSAFGVMRLAMMDVQSAVVQYLDASDVWQTVPGTVGRDDGGWYVEASDPGAPWTSIRVDYVCAMPADKVPAVALAVKILGAHFFENRSSAGDVPMAVTALLAPLRAVGV